MISRYRYNVGKTLRELILDLGPISTALDFGAGDGQFALNVSKIYSVRELIAIDVIQRKHSYYPVQLYDSARLPFDDDSFDLVYAVDSIHHCIDPINALHELMRCSRRYLILKDHIFWTKFDYMILVMLDELGNRRFGIKSSYRYQYAWNWIPEIRSGGFEWSSIIHPAHCERGPVGWIANKLQFFGVFESVAFRDDVKDARLLSG